MPEQNNEMTQEQEQEVNESLDQLNEFKKQLEEVKENNDFVNEVLTEYLQFNIEQQIQEDEQNFLQEEEQQEFKSKILEFIDKNNEFNENLLIQFENYFQQQEQFLTFVGDKLNEYPEIQETISDNILGLYGLIIIPIILVVYGLYKLINMWIKPFS